MPQRAARWKRLLEQDETLRRWFEDLARGSPMTAEENMRILTRYLRAHNLTPRQIVERATKDRRSVEDQIHDFITKLEKEKKSPSYINNFPKIVRSWLAFNDVQLVRKFKIRNAGATPTLDDERVPTPDELRSIFSTASPRGRVIISFLAFSGVRPEVLGDLRAMDGLRIKDLPELKLEGKTVSFSHIPTQVVVRASLSKAGHRYFTFLPQEGVDYLKAYLEDRLASGEKLDGEAPIIRVQRGFEDKQRAEGVDKSPFIVTRNITREVREAMRPRYTWRPYVLRAYFDTQLLLAESGGKLPHAYRAFFMGHKGDIEARYTTNKGRLPSDLVEAMRQKYADATGFLETSVRQREDPTANAVRLVLSALGYSDQELAELNVEGKTLQELQTLLKERAAKPRRRDAPGDAYAAQQRIIPLSELDAALTQGWAYKATLPDGRAVVESHAPRAA